MRFMSIDSTLSEAEMRRAISSRDSAFDGRFVYAVVTTGVYCRPSCPSRPARPENLRFYRTGEAAGKAGYRPCKRCAPDDANRELQRLIHVARYIEEHAQEKLRLADLGARFGMSPAYLQRSFKAQFGVSPKACQDAARVRAVKASLKAGDEVTGAIFEAGYGSTSRFYGGAMRHVGMAPASYRSGGAGEVIGFGCRMTAFGLLMMAASARGVCFVMFGDNEPALTAQLEAEFPKADLVPMPEAQNGQLDAWMDALDAYLAATAPRPDLPLDLRGTAFQILTWNYLLQIPEGETATYTDVANGIGKPKAVRAAASACGKNRLAVLIPCHRVLRGDGGMGGYRWGVERKRALLDKERANG